MITKIRFYFNKIINSNLVKFAVLAGITYGYYKIHIDGIITFQQFILISNINIIAYLIIRNLNRRV